MSFASSSTSSTSALRSISTTVPHRYREIEGRPFSDGALRPDVAAVPAHHARHDREADAVTRIVVGGVEPLEYLEQLLREAHVEADADVAHVEDGFATAHVSADLDGRRLPGLRELAG